MRGNLKSVRALLLALALVTAVAVVLAVLVFPRFGHQPVPTPQVMPPSPAGQGAGATGEKTPARTDAQPAGGRPGTSVPGTEVGCNMLL